MQDSKTFVEEQEEEAKFFKSAEMPSIEDQFEASLNFLRDFDNFKECLIQNYKQREEECLKGNSELEKLNKSLHDDIVKYYLNTDKNEVQSNLLQRFMELLVLNDKVGSDNAKLLEFQVEICHKLNEMYLMVGLPPEYEEKGFKNIATMDIPHWDLMNALGTKNVLNVRPSQCSLPYFSNFIEINVNRLVVDSAYEQDRLIVLEALCRDFANHNVRLYSQGSQTKLFKIRVEFEMPEIAFPANSGRNKRLKLLLDQLDCTLMPEQDVNPKVHTVTEFVSAHELLLNLYALYMQQVDPPQALDVKKMFELLRSQCIKFLLQNAEQESINQKWIRQDTQTKMLEDAKETKLDAQKHSNKKSDKGFSHAQELLKQQTKTMQKLANDGYELAYKVIISYEVNQTEINDMQKEIEDIQQQLNQMEEQFKNNETPTKVLFSLLPLKHQKQDQQVLEYQLYNLKYEQQKKEHLKALHYIKLFEIMESLQQQLLQTNKIDISHWRMELNDVTTWFVDKEKELMTLYYPERNEQTLSLRKQLNDAQQHLKIKTELEESRHLDHINQVEVLQKQLKEDYEQNLKTKQNYENKILQLKQANHQLMIKQKQEEFNPEELEVCKLKIKDELDKVQLQKHVEHVEDLQEQLEDVYEQLKLNNEQMTFNEERHVKEVDYFQRQLEVAKQQLKAKDKQEQLEVQSHVKRVEDLQDQLIDVHQQLRMIEEQKNFNEEKHVEIVEYLKRGLQFNKQQQETKDEQEKLQLQQHKKNVEDLQKQLNNVNQQLKMKEEEITSIQEELEVSKQQLKTRDEQEKLQLRKHGKDVEDLQSQLDYVNQQLNMKEEKKIFNQQQHAKEIEYLQEKFKNYKQELKTKDEQEKSEHEKHVEDLQEQLKEVNQQLMLNEEQKKIIQEKHVEIVENFQEKLKLTEEKLKTMDEQEKLQLQKHEKHVEALQRQLMEVNQQLKTNEEQNKLMQEKHLNEAGYLQRKLKVFEQRLTTKSKQVKLQNQKQVEDLQEHLKDANHRENNELIEKLQQNINFLQQQQKQMEVDELLNQQKHGEQMYILNQQLDDVHQKFDETQQELRKIVLQLGESQNLVKQTSDALLTTRDQQISEKLSLEECIADRNQQIIALNEQLQVEQKAAQQSNKTLKSIRRELTKTIRLEVNLEEQLEDAKLSSQEMIKSYQLTVAEKERDIKEKETEISTLTKNLDSLNYDSKTLYRDLEGLNNERIAQQAELRNYIAYNNQANAMLSDLLEKVSQQANKNESELRAQEAEAEMRKVKAKLQLAHDTDISKLKKMIRDVEFQFEQVEVCKTQLKEDKQQLEQKLSQTQETLAQSRASNAKKEQDQIRIMHRLCIYRKENEMHKAYKDKLQIICENLKAQLSNRVKTEQKMTQTFLSSGSDVRKEDANNYSTSC